MKLQSFFYIVPSHDWFFQGIHKHNVSTQLGQIKISCCCFYLKPFCHSACLARHSMFAILFFLAHPFFSKRHIFTTPFQTRPTEDKKEEKDTCQTFFSPMQLFSSQMFCSHNSGRKNPPRISLNSPLNLGINHLGGRSVYFA